MADTLALPTRPPPPPPPMDPERFDGSRSDPQPVPIPVRAHSTQVAAGWLEKIHPQESRANTEEEKLGKATAPNSNQVCGAGSQFAQLAGKESGEGASIALHATPPVLKLSHPIPSVRPSRMVTRASQPTPSPGRWCACIRIHQPLLPTHHTHRPHEMNWSQRLVGDLSSGP